MSIENGVLKTSGVVQLRGGTLEDMRKVNPLLARREVAVEIDTGKIKVGNGTDYWNDLPYAGSNGTSGGSLNFPDDNKVYVIKNGAFVQASLIEQPSEWEPEIDNSEIIILTLDEDMEPYQLKGRNVEVNS